MLLHKSVEHDSRVRREAPALAEAGHEVAVLELEPPARGHARRLRRACRPRRRPGSAARCRSTPTASCFLAVVPAPARRSSRPDVVHAHDAAMLLPGLLGARLTRAKLVYDSHELATGVPYRDGALGALRARHRADRVPARRRGDHRHRRDRRAAAGAATACARRPVVVRNVPRPRPPGGPTGALRERLGIGDAPLVLHQGAPGARPRLRAADRRDAASCRTRISCSSARRRSRATRTGCGRAAAGAERALPARPCRSRSCSRTPPTPTSASRCSRTRARTTGWRCPTRSSSTSRRACPWWSATCRSCGALVEEHGIGWTVAAGDPAAIAAGLRAAIEAPPPGAARRSVGATSGERLLGVYDGAAPIDGARSCSSATR